MVLLHEIPSELILSIYQSCTSIYDVLSLSLTCRRLHSLLHSSQKISILFAAAEIEFGPLSDIIQLVTLNNSQATHSIRDPPLSLALLRHVILTSKVANQWEQLYPAKKWKDDHVARRLLNPDEGRRLRRAVYRYWLYTEAFHNRAYPRSIRMHPHCVSERNELLRNWSTTDLAEIEDFREVMREVLHSICPSNGKVQRKQELQGIPQDRLVGSMSMPSFHTSPSLTNHLFHTCYDDTYLDERRSRHHNSLASCSSIGGWGDDISHYYLMEDLMKLNPAEVMWLLHNARVKWQIEEYLRCMGDWFDNNGETFGQTFDSIMVARGNDPDEIREHIARRSMGIVSDQRLMAGP